MTVPKRKIEAHRETTSAADRPILHSATRRSVNRTMSLRGLPQPSAKGLRAHILRTSRKIESLPITSLTPCVDARMSLCIRPLILPSLHPCLSQHLPHRMISNSKKPLNYERTPYRAGAPKAKAEHPQVEIQAEVLLLTEVCLLALRRHDPSNPPLDLTSGSLICLPITALQRLTHPGSLV